jgi:hypothetical protein
MLSRCGCEVDVGEVGVGEVGVSEVGVGEVGVGEVGVGEVDVGEVSVGEVDFSEVGVGEVDTGEGDVAEMGVIEDVKARVRYKSESDGEISSASVRSWRLITQAGSILSGRKYAYAYISALLLSPARLSLNKAHFAI